MAARAWPEIVQAREEKRRELLLNGPTISERITQEGFDKTVYSLELLNYLEIADTSLAELSNDIGKLANLVNLVLRGNKLTILPSTVGQLKVLRLLDVSNNSIEKLPDEIGELSELHTLDCSHNKLTCLPSSFGKLLHLTIVNVSVNGIESLQPFCSDQLIHLRELSCSKNEVSVIPSEIGCLQALKKLDLSSNQIKDVPASLTDCEKLKDLFMQDNPFRDRRLGKLVQQSRGTKSILDYVRSHGVKTSAEPDDKTGKSKKKKGRKKAASLGSDLSDDMDKLTLNVLNFKDSSVGGAEVIVQEGVATVRPYIVCCVLRDVDLQKGNKFKNFITAQTKLHEGSLCAKRTKATIATHDLDHVKFPLTYRVKRPAEIELIPLGRSKSTNASLLMSQLRKEADDMRKEAKRNTVSGIHKYLELLDKHDVYPCLCDREDRVISFPPITNADITKISQATRHILLEVTSTCDLATCKRVLDAFIHRSVGILLDQPDSPGGDAEDGGIEAAPSSDRRSLSVEQVKVAGSDGSLKVLYPARNDLVDLTDVRVVRS